jgi:hypothetical protein
VQKLGTELVNGEIRTTYADDEGNLVMKAESDLTHIIEANKASYNSIDERARWGDGQLVADIPFPVIEDLNKQGILRGFVVIDQKRMKAWLNNPDNRFFRTRPGRV